MWTYHKHFIPSHLCHLEYAFETPKVGSGRRMLYKPNQNIFSHFPPLFVFNEMPDVKISQEYATVLSFSLKYACRSAEEKVPRHEQHVG